MNNPEFNIPDKSVERIRKVLAEQPEVQKALLFGSRAKGFARSGSDIDLALFGEDLTINELTLLARKFEESSIPYQVDLCLLHKVRHLGLREHIEHVGKVFYIRGQNLSHVHSKPREANL